MIISCDVALLFDYPLFVEYFLYKVNIDLQKYSLLRTGIITWNLQLYTVKITSKEVLKLIQYHYQYHTVILIKNKCRY